MIKKLTEYDQSELQARITAMTRTNHKSVRSYYTGDHWQSQAGWVGPLALESDGTTSTSGMDVIQGKFVYENIVAEIVRRHISGVFGENPHWQLSPKRDMKVGDKPTDAESRLIQETESALTSWWDKRTQDFTDDESKADPFTQFAVNLLVLGRAVLRIFVPSSDTTVSASTLQEALDYIYVQCADITQSGVITDKNTQEKIGTYFYNDADTQYLETTWQQGGITFLKTVINGAEATTTHTMRGNLFIYEARREPLVTDSIISLQKLLNMTLTMLGRNVHVGGSPETFFLNAMLPGKTETVDGKQVFVADPVQTGAGVVHNYTGVPMKDGITGQVSYTTPNVVFRDPVPVDTFVNTVDILYRSILDEAQQLHALISGDASASGEARIQALADFENSLKETAKCLNSALRWAFESALSLAASIMSSNGMFDAYRMMVQCNTNAGPVSTEMLRTLSGLVSSNFISHETALARANIQDVGSELQRIEMQKEQAMQEAQQQMDMAGNANAAKANQALTALRSGGNRQAQNGASNN